MKNETKGAAVWIAYRLSVDALVLYLAGGMGFLLAETVLPGIFSQRVNFFFFLFGFFACMVLVLALGALVRRQMPSFAEKEHAPFFPNKRRRNIFFIAVFCAFALFLAPVMRSASPAAFPLLVLSGALVSAVVTNLLLQKEYF